MFYDEWQQGEGATNLQSKSSQIKAMVFFWVWMLASLLTGVKSEEETDCDCMKHL